MLLDEHLDRRINKAFASDFEVIHVHTRGWSGKKNGELLRLADKEFDALITMDQNLEHQQNLKLSRLSIVVIYAVSNRRADIEPLIPEVNQALPNLKPGEVVRVGTGL